LTQATMQDTLAALRPQFLRFARLQLRSDAAAEDVVQDALLAAIEGAQGFGGAASVKTWAFSILRNKIVDEIRRRSRQPSLPDPEDMSDDVDALFSPDGHWGEMPASWGDPEQCLEQKRFWEIFEICLDAVPAKPGRVFMMREFLGLETDEICKELTISASNCWVLLHRARLVLRECLALRWFNDPLKK
jgi:RNA polymerase sigma-70 factor (TIGR02943 family)